MFSREKKKKRIITEVLLEEMLETRDGISSKVLKDEVVVSNIP
jgi:hypothetical protein